MKSSVLMFCIKVILFVCIVVVVFTRSPLCCVCFARGVSAHLSPAAPPDTSSHSQPFRSARKVNLF